MAATEGVGSSQESINLTLDLRNTDDARANNTEALRTLAAAGEGGLKFLLGLVGGPVGGLAGKAGGGGADGSIADFTKAQEEFLQKQIAFQSASLEYQAESNVERTKHDTSKNAVQNIRA